MNRFMYATSAALVASILGSPVSAQRGGMPADTTGSHGAPSLRALVQASKSESDMRVVVQRFNADRAALGRRYDIPLSPVLHARLRAFYDGWQRQLEDVDAQTLNSAGRADLAALREQITRGLAAVALEEKQRAEIVPLLPFLRTLQELQEKRRDRLPIDAMPTAQTVADVLKEVRRLTAALDSSAALPEPLRTVGADAARRAAALIAPAAAQSPTTGPAGRRPSAGALRVMLDDWFSYFNGYDPLFTWWVHKPYEELTAALDAYSAAIAKRWRDNKSISHRAHRVHGGSQGEPEAISSVE